MALPELIDHAMPYRGECGLCGGPDARHRVLDAISSRRTAGDSRKELAADYGLSVEVIGEIDLHWNEESQRWLNEPHGLAIDTWKRSMAICICGWISNPVLHRSSARRAWRRHLERAK